jgi:hypothetical protein
MKFIEAAVNVPDDVEGAVQFAKIGRVILFADHPSTRLLEDVESSSLKTGQAGDQVSI